jgi:Sodium / potassium ATPase beta chain
LRLLFELAAAILLYYLGFYAVLAAFWAACLAAFMHTIDYSQPTQQHKYSMLKDNPGG